MPSSAASAAMAASFLAKPNASSLMLIWKCGHLAPAQHRADGLANCRCSMQLPVRPLNARLDADQFLLGGRQQLAPLACPLLPQQRVLADHQALARKIGAVDLRHVAGVKQ